MANKIAKNTIYLYIRMIITIIISLYTSRVVLEALGVVDYGIYNVVGGIVAIISFLSSALSASTSRFLSTALGHSDQTELIRVFCTAKYIHRLFAVALLILGETIGVWAVNHVLVIPESQIYAANWTFQLSLFATALALTQIPYDALIVAHEDLHIFAYLQILSSLLKLGIVFLLMIISFNKLILYSILVFLVSIIIRTLYWGYAKRNYQETHSHAKVDKQIVKQMASFSGWDLLGHIGFTARQQGTNIVMNMFFGAAINAASGLATTVQGIISSFAYNIVTAVRPQIIKSYATGDLQKFRSLIKNAIFATLCMIMLICIPLILNLHTVLTIWLKNIPDYCYQFTLYCLIGCIVSSISSVFLIGIHATGDVKRSSLGRNIIYILSLFCIFLFLKMSFPPTCAYIITQLMTLCNDVYILHSVLSPQIIRNILFQNVAIITIGMICGIIAYYITIENTFLKVIISTLVYILTFIPFVFFIVTNSSQKKMIIELIKAKLNFI